MEWEERDLTGQQHGWEHDEVEAGGRQQILGASIPGLARPPASHPLGLYHGRRQNPPWRRLGHPIRPSPRRVELASAHGSQASGLCRESVEAGATSN
jgi:hypothetical protein